MSSFYAVKPWVHPVLRRTEKVWRNRQQPAAAALYILPSLDLDAISDCDEIQVDPHSPTIMNSGLWGVEDPSGFLRHQPSMLQPLSGY